MANGQQPVTQLPPGFDPATLLQQGSNPQAIAGQLPPTPGPSTGLFSPSQRRGSDVPGLGPAAKGQFPGIFGFQKRRRGRIVKENLEAAREFADSSNIEWTEEIENKATQIMESTAGINGVMAMVQAEGLNQPAAVAERIRLRGIENERLVREQEAHQISVNNELRKQKAIQQYGYLHNNITEHNRLTGSYAQFSGDIQTIDELLEMNRQFGLERRPIMFDQLRGRIRGAYRTRTRRLFNIGQRLFQTGVITPGEIPFVEEAFPTFDQWNSDFTEGEREVRLLGLRQWIVQKMQIADSQIPGQNPYRGAFNAQPRNITDQDILGMLGIPELPGNFKISDESTLRSGFTPEEQQQTGEAFERLQGQPIF